MAAPHADETRAAVLAALLTGQSISAIAETFHLSRATVRSWRAAAGLADGPPPVNQEKRRDIGGLIAAYLDTALATLRVQAEHFSDKTWLGKQPAAELAVLHGVLADKAFRLLSALETEPDRAFPPVSGADDT